MSAILWLMTFILLIQAVIVIGFLGLFYQLGKLAYSDLRRRLSVYEVNETPPHDITGVYKRQELGGGKFKIYRSKEGDEGIIASDYKDTLDWTMGIDARTTRR